MRAFVVPVYLAICVMTGTAACPRASAEEPVDYTHTLLLRRPLMEQELETQVGYRSGTGGREADATIALDIRLLPRWQIELAVPLLYIDPSGAPAEAGIGDLVLENKLLLYFSPEHKFMLSGGVDVVLPTGSPDRGLGGAVGFTPFAVVGFKVGGFDVLADIAYRTLFRPRSIGGDLQQLTTGIAIAHPLTRRLTPFVELTTVTNINPQRGLDERLVGRPQVYVGPGLNLRIRPGLDFVLGVQAPLRDARTFNVGGRAGLIVDF
jgi:outer membrane putative beta-barrel porin/alpha-amylase